MFPAWRLQLREAKQALDQGNLEEADALLDDELMSYLPGKKLSEKVARQTAQRARQYFESGESSLGFEDLHRACRRAGYLKEVQQVKNDVLKEELSQAERLLASNQIDLALGQIARLERHLPLRSEGVAWRRVGEKMKSAEAAAARGNFTKAIDSLQQAQALLGDSPQISVDEQITQREQDFAQRGARYQQHSQQLHQALGARDWTKVLAEADEILAIAPQCTTAQRARRQAWSAVGMKSTSAHNRQARAALALNDTNHGNAQPKADTVTERTPPRKMLMWVDGVGGFLIVDGEELVLGQPAGNEAIDLPILGDLSRRHAVLRRDGSAYVIDPVQLVYLNGKRLNGPAVLSHGDEIGLGQNVRLRFRKPHALSATACLDFLSRHRTQPRADGVVLMAESVVLGPKTHSHIGCPQWEHDLILFRRGDGYSCRSTGELRIDGEESGKAGAVTDSSQVEGEEFSLSLEAV